MPKFMKKPVVIEARQTTTAEIVLTAHGRVQAEAGDWILTDPTSGDMWPVKPDIFAATYEAVGVENA